MKDINQYRYITHKNKNIMIQFTIDSFSGGISGRPYKSIKDAIQDGGYSVWCSVMLFYSLPLNEQKTHIQFIREQLNLYNDL